MTENKTLPTMSRGSGVTEGREGARDSDIAEV